VNGLAGQHRVDRGSSLAQLLMDRSYSYGQPCLPD